MFKTLTNAIALLIVMTVMTGVIYPLVVSGVALLVFPKQARGSLVTIDGKTVGSSLIGQQFDDPKYFWGRLSATSPTPYNASASSGSNLGPTNPALVDVAYIPPPATQPATQTAAAPDASTTQATSQPAPPAPPTVNARISALHDADPAQKAPIPVDLVTASGSGLDPEISPAAAAYQAGRIANTRGLEESVVLKLIEQNVQGRQLGVLGEPRVNVLTLNLALDNLSHK